MKTVHVVAAIIREGNKIFATQRRGGEFSDGWEFPGGKVEPGETAKEALAREIKEELDVEAEIGVLIETVEYDYPQFHLTMECFLCKLRSDDAPRLMVHKAAAWLTKDSIDSVAWLPADLGLVEKIKKELLGTEGEEAGNEGGDKAHAGKR